jgi:hypothetical protein
LAVLYDFATHALIRDMPYASRSSQSPDLQTILTARLTFNSHRRLRTEKESKLFDHTWVLPDIEKVK